MTYRFYYHTSKNAPQVWSVDEGSQSSEIHVKGVRSNGCRWTAVQQPDHEPGAPAGWIEIQASSMTIENGVAVFAE